MRILELRFKNLNSLAGEWRINFTHPEYESSGIFAIVGPTGSGKTTILDAICLALYGQTPRLGKITKATNELMTRQTAECFAEVIFESSEGKFKCHWSQKRARKKPDGELQQSEHEIADAETGKILESKIKEVLGKVCECTGMNFEQFTRSILLAQGDFAAFLGAKPDERAPILEQITGTGIYTEISKRVHERTAMEKMRLGTFQEELGSIQILSDEERETLHRESEIKQRDAIEISRQKTSLEHAITWLKQIGRLEEELATLDESRQNLNVRKQENLGNLTLLKNARSAKEFEPEYVQMTTKIQDQRERLEKIDHDTNEYAECDKKFRDLQVRIGNIEKLIQEHAADSPLREHIGTISQIITTYRETSGKFSRYTDKREKAKQDLADAIKNREEKDNRKIIVERDHAEAVGIIRKLQQDLATVLEENEVEFWYEKKMACSGEIDRLTTLQATILQSETLNREIETLEVRALKLLAEKKEHSVTLTHLQKEIALTEKITCEQEEKRRQRERIRDLEEERKLLKTGKPCPLCGSETHPYVTDQIPHFDEAEAEREGFLKKLKDLRNDEAGITKKSIRIDADFAQNTGELAKKRDLLQENEKAITVGTANLWIASDAEDRKHRIEHSITKSQKELAGCDSVLAKSGEIQKKIVEATVRSQSMKGELDRVQAEIHQENLKITDNESSVKNLTNEIATLAHECETSRAAISQNLAPYRIENIDFENLDTILNSLVQRRDEYIGYESQKLELSNAAKDHSARLQSLAEQIEKQQKIIKDAGALITELKGQFKHRIISAGFLDCPAFLKARLERKHFEELELLEDNLRTEEIKISTLLDEKRKVLEGLRAETITDRSLVTLEEEFAICSQKYDVIQGEILEIRLKIARYESQIKEREEFLEKIKKQQTEFDRWEKLNQLIGSHDGKKFRLFAQGITFDLLISHANKHLQRLNNRYILIRTDSGQLDMSVVDTYQAGEIRSTKNLSGGESFIVSLALALGLSDMASNNVRVDSLFLDEGFGTLDNESLEIALEALISLQRDGKLIGIISHVSALKERISTQIVVEKKSGGLSSLTAPGCSCKL